MNAPEDFGVSIGDKRDGYPCPKDGTMLTLIDKTADGGQKGAWCSECRTLWIETGEVDLADLDALPEARDD